MLRLDLCFVFFAGLEEYFDDDEGQNSCEDPKADDRAAPMAVAFVVILLTQDAVVSLYTGTDYSSHSIIQIETKIKL